MIQYFTGDLLSGGDRALRLERAIVRSVRFASLLEQAEVDAIELLDDVLELVRQELGRPSRLSDFNRRHERAVWTAMQRSAGATDEAGWLQPDRHRRVQCRREGEQVALLTKTRRVFERDADDWFESPLERDR